MTRPRGKSSAAPGRNRNREAKILRVVRRALTRGMVAVLAWAAPARGGGPPPDYFESLRMPTLLQEDRSYLVREKAAAASSPPLFRVRRLFLRLKSYGEAAREFWPVRSLALVEMPSGRRYVLETTLPPLDVQHPDDAEPRPWGRVSSGGNTEGVSMWRGSNVSEELSPREPPLAPCGGAPVRVLGGGQSFDFYPGEGRKRTVSTLLAEIRSAAFPGEEAAELRLLRKLPAFPPIAGMPLEPRLPLQLLFTELPQLSPGEKNLVLAEDPEPARDLSPWRSMTYLPFDMPAYVAVPNPVLSD